MRQAWGVAGVLDTLIANRPKEARARACLMLLQADQVAVDRGNWGLAAQASLELPPPFHQFAAHLPPDPNEQPMSRHMDPRWGEIFLQQLKETDDYLDRRKKHNSKRHGQARSAGRGSGCGKERGKEQGEGEGLGPGPRCMNYEPRCPGRSFEGADVKVPGAGAPVIRVAAMANSLPRRVLASSGDFSSFFSGLVRNPQEMPGDVFILAYAAPISGGTSARRRLLWRVVKEIELVNLAVAVLDWLHLGKPRRAPTGLEAGVPLSKRQWEMVELLAGLIGDGDFSFTWSPPIWAELLLSWRIRICSWGRFTERLSHWTWGLLPTSGPGLQLGAVLGPVGLVVRAAPSAVPFFLWQSRSAGCAGSSERKS